MLKDPDHPFINGRGHISSLENNKLALTQEKNKILLFSRAAAVKISAKSQGVEKHLLELYAPYSFRLS